MRNKITINAEDFLKYSGANSFEDLKDQILEWIDRSKRKSEMGGYSDEFCAEQIMMIFYCTLHKVREKYFKKSGGTHREN